MKKFLLIFLIALILVLVVSYACSGMLKRYVLERVQEIAAEYLNPTLVIEDMQYEFPFTVHVQSLSLEQDGTKIVEIPRGSITLEGIPYTKGQVRFAGFELEDPVIRFQVDAKDRLVGWSDLVRDDEDEDDSTQSVRTSDAFAVRKISIDNGTIEYADVDNPDRTMRLDDITLQIDAHPNDGGSTTPDPDAAELPKGAPEIPRGQNWYLINSTLDRAPLVEITVDGALNIDTGDVLVRSLTANTSLAPDNVQVLPPQIQETIESWDIRGDCTLRSWGTILVDDPLEGPIDLEMTLTDATFGGDEGRIEIEKIDSSLNLNAGLAIMNRFAGTLLGGTIEADGEILLEDEPDRTPRRPKTEAQAAEVERSQEQPEMIPGRPAYSMIFGVQLDKVDLATLTGNRPSGDRLRGELALDFEMNAIATDLPGSLAGTGRCDICNGRLANIPVVSALGRVMNVVLLRNVDNDRMTVDLDLRPDGVVLEDISLIAGLMAVRGRGILRFNDTMDLVLNGGPMERLQESIGALGRALGSLTDRIVRYQVTGEIGSPRVRVRPFGINAGDPTAPPPDPTPSDSTTPDPDESETP